MAIHINRFTALLLLVLLYPVALVIRLFRLLTGHRKPAYVGTIECDLLTYNGDRPLLIAVWATWASVWSAATADVVEQLKAEFAGRCEFAFVEASTRKVTDAYGVEVVPTLILRHRGKDVGRFINTLTTEDVRSAIAKAIA